MWKVVEEDQFGELCVYHYRTREQVRKHLRRLRNNPFFKGWKAWGFNLSHKGVVYA